MATIVNILDSIYETFEANFAERAAPADIIRLGLSMSTVQDQDEEVPAVMVFIAVAGQDEANEMTCTARVPCRALVTDEAVLALTDALWDMIQSRRMAKVFEAMGLEDDQDTPEVEVDVSFDEALERPEGDG